MPTPKKGARLGGSASHQKKILANLAAQLFVNGQIKTTDAKARLLRPYAEKIITKAKGGTIADRRNVAKLIEDKDVIFTLFHEVAPQFADRNGGYIRIIKLENRRGDNAPMSLVQLVTEPVDASTNDRSARVAASQKAEENKAAEETKDAEAAEDAAEATENTDATESEEKTDADDTADDTADAESKE